MLSIDTYIRSLNYDPRRLLSVQESGSIESLPPKDKTATSNGVIICTNTNRSLNKDLTDVVILSPTSGVVFPGALVRANQRLAEGKPDPITLPRDPITLRIDLPGLQNQGTKVVQNPTNSNVQAAIDEVLEYWNTQPSSQGYVNKARSFLQVTKAYSAQQLALDLGFSTKWTGGDVSAKISASSSKETSVTIAFYKQVFYTVTFDSPTEPSSVFASNVSLDQVKQVIDNNNPPAYVRSVDYGRIVMVKMETASSETKAALESALNYATSGGMKVGATVDARYHQIIQNSTFTVVALGGNPNAAATITQPKDLENLGKLIQTGATYSRNNPGAPISYTVAFLKDNQIATLGLTTNYTEKECIRYENGFVKVKHKGAYVAKFLVSWEEQDAKGNYTQKSWESGNQTAGYTQQIDLPGDARNVKIQGWAKTGLVWNPWGEAINTTENGPTRECYTIFGTTLNRRWAKEKE